MYNEMIQKALLAYLDKHNLSYRIGSNGSIFFQVSLDGRFSNATYVIDIRRKDFLTYAKAPINGDPDDKAEMLELSRFFARVNYSLRSGNFEMDYRDGEIRYKVYVDCDGLEEPTEAMIGTSIGIAGAMLRRFSEGILAVIYKDLSAEEAVELCK